MTEDNSQEFARITSIAEDLKTVTVKSLVTDAKEVVAASKLRFLARAYTCRVDDLDTKQMPHELSQIIGYDSSLSIVLIQVVYAMQNEAASV